MFGVAPFSLVRAPSGDLPCPRPTCREGFTPVYRRNFGLAVIESGARDHDPLLSRGLELPPPARIAASCPMACPVEPPRQREDDGTQAAQKPVHRGGGNGAISLRYPRRGVLNRGAAHTRRSTVTRTACRRGQRTMDPAGATTGKSEPSSPSARRPASTSMRIRCGGHVDPTFGLRALPEAHPGSVRASRGPPDPVRAEPHDGAPRFAGATTRLRREARAPGPTLPKPREVVAADAGSRPLSQRSSWGRSSTMAPGSVARASFDSGGIVCGPLSS